MVPRARRRDCRRAGVSSPAASAPARQSRRSARGSGEHASSSALGSARLRARRARRRAVAGRARLRRDRQAQRVALLRRRRPALALLRRVPARARRICRRPTSATAGRCMLLPVSLVRRPKPRLCAAGHRAAEHRDPAAGRAALRLRDRQPHRRAARSGTSPRCSGSRSLTSESCSWSRVTTRSTPS